jgi:dihydrofolate reductase
VLSHEAPDDKTDPTIKLVSGTIRSAIAAASEAARGKDVLVIGADVARQPIREGLVDDIVVYLAPILLGDGVRSFDWHGMVDAVGND